MKITWFLNLNKSLDLNASNLFLGNQVVINDNKLFVPTNNFYVINKNDGRIIYKKISFSHLNLLSLIITYFQ